MSSQPIVDHICWVVDCPETIQSLVDLFGEIDYLALLTDVIVRRNAHRVGMEMLNRIDQGRV